jgi:hypothetical protein
MKSNSDRERGLKEFEAEEIFHRREWLAQRIGWAVLAVLLLAACAGLLGNGPLSHRTIATQNGELQIDRFAHRDGPTIWVIEPNAAASEFKLRVSSGLLQRTKIESVTPAPLDQAATASSVLFTFRALAPKSKIVFHIEPQYVGWNGGEFQLGDAPPVTVQQFVYP